MDATARMERGPIAYLDGMRLTRALRAGIARLLDGQEHLNSINVFPVADSDTGTNMALTMQSVLVALDAHDDRHAGRTLTTVADAALDGARGNSGAILAQFFQGLSDASVDLPRLAPADFGDAVEHGARAAREALAEPRDGTVLSVLADFANEVSQRARDGVHDFRMLLTGGLERARASLADTPNRLEVLRRANVVDAGGEGFVMLLAGIDRFLHSGSLREPVAPMPRGLAEHAVETGVDAVSADGHRWCTECMIHGDDIDRRRLRETLTAMGSSLVLAGTRNRCKVHIHVDSPDAVFRAAADFGAVSGEKADDMHRQHGTARHDAARRVAVITDSAADMPEDMIESLDVHLVPVRVNFGERSFLDKVSINNREFFEELARNPVHPTTSQPAPGDFRRLYEFLASHYAHVVSINLTAKVSGTWQAARCAAERVSTPERVHVVDCRNVSLGQGLIAMHAARCAQDGMDVDEVLAEVEHVIPRTHTFGLVRDLSYAVRGGRVPRSRKLVADLLRITPVLACTPDGRVTANGVILGRRHAVRKLVDFVLRRIDPARAWRVAVGHAADPDSAAWLADAFRERLPRIDALYQTDIGSAFGVHGGPGTLVVALQEATPRV